MGHQASPTRKLRDGALHYRIETSTELHYWDFDESAIERLGEPSVAPDSNLHHEVFFRLRPEVPTDQPHFIRITVFE